MRSVTDGSVESSFRCNHYRTLTLLSFTTMSSSSLLSSVLNSGVATLIRISTLAQIASPLTLKNEVCISRAKCNLCGNVKYHLAFLGTAEVGDLVSGDVITWP